VGELKGIDPAFVEVPVVGGHAGATILPLLSQTTPPMSFDPALVPTLTKRIQNAGTEVVEAKAGKGSATLSMAFAAARMGESCLKGLTGNTLAHNLTCLLVYEENPKLTMRFDLGLAQTECAYVENTIAGLPFFASKVTLGPEGIAAVHGLGSLSAFEAEALKAVIPQLEKEIAKGVAFVNK